jgi:hypothetical protein
MNTARPFGLNSAAALLLLSLSPAFAQDPNKPEQPPGEPKSAKMHVLETGADMLQGDGPLNHIDAHLCGFHFYAG